MASNFERKLRHLFDVAHGKKIDRDYQRGGFKQTVRVHTNHRIKATGIHKPLFGHAFSGPVTYQKVTSGKVVPVIPGVKTDGPHFQAAISKQQMNNLKQAPRQLDVTFLRGSIVALRQRMLGLDPQGTCTGHALVGYEGNKPITECI